MPASACTTSTATRYPALPRDRGYFRDVGTLDDYYQAQMDLVSVHRPGPVGVFRRPGCTDNPTVDTASTLSAAEVLTAARGLLRGQGADGLTMGTLAQRLASSPDAVAHHFPATDDICRTLAAAHQRQLADHLTTRTTNTLGGLRTLLLGIATHECSDKAGHLALHAGSLTAEQDPLFQLLHTRVRAQLDHRAAADSQTLATALWTAVQPLSQRHTVSSVPSRHPGAQAPSEVLVDLLLTGLRTTIRRHHSSTTHQRTGPTTPEAERASPT